MDQERTYKWIQDRIRELHSGTLSDGDRSRLEEIAKSDPFLRDALDGYSTSTYHDHSHRLKTLSHRVASKHTAKRRKLIPSRNQWVMQAVAASLMLILVTWAVFYYVGKENTAVLVTSDMEETIPSSPPAITTAPDDTDAAAENTIVMGESTHELEQTSPGLRANAEAKAKEYLSTKDQSVSSPPSISKESPTSSDVALREETYTINEPSVTQPAPGAETKNDDHRIAADEDIASQQALAKRDEGFYANQMHPAMMASRVTGQIIDPFGQPVTGAQLSIANTNLTTITDPYGHFELFLPDKVVGVEIYSPGYKDTMIDMAQGKENYVVMLSQSLQAYSTYSTKGKEMQAEKTQAIPAQNISASYLAYLSTSSKYPVESSISPSSKQVTLQFSINSSGRPEQVRVKKTNAGKAFDAEAVRLVRNGPDWICEGGYPCNKEYTIFFK